MLSSRRKMVGVFGGTFDPVHFGHLRVAVELTEQLCLDQLRLLPCHQPYHRSEPACDSRHRLQMARLAVGSDARLFVDDRELQRQGPSYTVDTLASLRKELGTEVSLCLAMGADAFIKLPQWQRWQELLTLAHIVVMTRPGWQVPEHGETADLLRTQGISKAEQLQLAACGNILLLEVTALDISATDIRKIIAIGRSPRFLLPDQVWGYIQLHQLYGYGVTSGGVNQ